MIPDKSRQHLQSHFETVVVVDHQVGIFGIRLDIAFEGRQHVFFIAIQHILQRIVPLDLVALDRADELEVFLGVEEDLEIEQVADLFIVEDKDPFHDQYGSGLKGDQFRRDVLIVERIFGPFHDLAVDQAKDIRVEGFFVD